MNGSAKDRRQVRLLLKKEVVINNNVKGYALDISEGGMFIYTHIPFPRNTIVELEFTIGESIIPIKTQACVQFVQTGVGIGVEFANMTPADSERIKQFIEKNIAAHPLGKEGAVQDTRKKILLVDDSPTARSTYKGKLVLMGYIVREASNGVEAIKALGNEKLDLIVLDLQMEGMDGLKFLQLMRTNHEWKKIKIIVLSGRLNPQDAERISAFNIADMLPKMTTTPNKLVERVKYVLEE